MAAVGGWRRPGADLRQGHPSSELRKASPGRAGPRQLRLVAGLWFFTFRFWVGFFFLLACNKIPSKGLCGLPAPLTQTGLCSPGR